MKTKDQILSFFRATLVAGGAFFFGKVFLGTTLDANIWEGIAGAVLSLAGIVWGIVDKTATIEMIQSGVKSSFLVIGGLFVTAGKITAETLNNWVTLALLVLPVIYGWLERKKSAAIAKGKIGIADLSGVNEKRPDLINPTVKTPK